MLTSSHAQRKGSPGFYCQIDTSSFLALFFVFLSIFIAAPPPFHHDMAILPRGHHAIWQPGAERDDAMIIYVSKAGDLYFGSNRVLPEQIPPIALEKIKDGSPKKIYLKIDPNAKYGCVEDVLDQIGRTGVVRVAFLTRQAGF